MSTFLNSQIKIYFLEKQTHIEENDITLTFGTLYRTHIERGFKLTYYVVSNSHRKKVSNSHNSNTYDLVRRVKG